MDRFVHMKVQRKQLEIKKILTKLKMKKVFTYTERKDTKASWLLDEGDGMKVVTNKHTKTFKIFFFLFKLNPPDKWK